MGNLRHLCVLGIVCFSTAMAMAAGASGATPEQEPWIAVPMPPGGQSIVLPVALAGQPLKFLCTSLPVHYFDESLRPQLGSVVGVKRIVGALAQDTPADVVKTPTLIVGSYELLPVKGDIAPMVDLSPVRQGSGADNRYLRRVFNASSNLESFYARLSEWGFREFTFESPL